KGVLHSVVSTNHPHGRGDVPRVEFVVQVEFLPRRRAHPVVGIDALVLTAGNIDARLRHVRAVSPARGPGERLGRTGIEPVNLRLSVSSSTSGPNGAGGGS